MRKLLALTLAMAMVLSLASVAMANPTNPDYGIEAVCGPEFDYGETVPNKDGFVVDPDAVNKYLRATDSLYFGDSLYYILYSGHVNEDGSCNPEPVEKASVAKELKVSAEWLMGEEYIKDVKIVPHIFRSPIDDGSETIYVVEISTNEAPEEVDEKDVIGTITLKASSKLSGLGKEQKIEAAFSLTNKQVDEDDEKFDETADDYYAYDFGDGEEEHEFNLFGNMGRFVVDTRGQGKLVINTDVDYNKGLEKAAPDVNYVYFNANNATFNKIGTLYLNADYGDHLYRVNKDGTLKEVKAPYDTDEEAFKVRTRTIASYVVSEKELDLDKVNASVLPAESALGASLVGSEVVAPVNPATGAAL